MCYVLHILPHVQFLIPELEVNLYYTVEALFVSLFHLALSYSIIIYRNTNTLSIYQDYMKNISISVFISISLYALFLIIFFHKLIRNNEKTS